MKPDKFLCYNNAIDAVLRSFLRDFEEADQDRIRGRVLDKLQADPFHGDAPATKAHVIVVTRNACRDFLRQYRRFGLCVTSDRFGGPTKTMLRLERKPPRKTPTRPAWRKVKAALGPRVARIPNVELYRAWCAGWSRSRTARHFGLTEDQVRGRLAYARKKILVSLNKATTYK